MEFSQRLSDYLQLKLAAAQEKNKGLAEKVNDLKICMKTMDDERTDDIFAKKALTASIIKLEEEGTYLMNENNSLKRLNDELLKKLFESSTHRTTKTSEKLTKSVPRSYLSLAMGVQKKITSW